MMTMKTISYAAETAGWPLKPYAFERRALRANDVVMEILYCGVCHSDLHMAGNDWGSNVYRNHAPERTAAASTNP
ncbi:D-arabinose 1-dehydrogenase-like Zn-dependent alcohol dehydrogenase [Azospirillum rugosum]|uniref:D-arabinose 1-dehydrogenase-like Zn-dependent alcohol dehydrogenase n=1 Tax=Azospirillum rugosum TaxID=416170 RepID=A0ABS4SWA8_9PROT|nr:D-arabinose 1-dehydrogenase-like Zn-dependent alcohol dehydrogenase [Azospirillum rugosum]MDQ0530565.1 D-arabinose 1-dehydrogenase-like Zn-dependent alcohol dehydrogenase [Azospirillum rugosum]